MPDRRALRFAVEVLILAAVAAAVTVADLQPLVIAGLMVLAWLVVSALEWAMLQGEAHYESGLPPSYYVPELRLPPPRYFEEETAAAPVAVSPAPVAEAVVEEVLAPEPIAVVPEVAEPAPEVEEPEPEVEKPELEVEPELEAAEPAPEVEAELEVQPELEVGEPEPEESEEWPVREPEPPAAEDTSSWFDSELPGTPRVPQFDAALVAAELEAVDAEAAPLPEPEPEPEVAVEPVAGASVEDERADEAELDFRVLADQLRAREPASASWFDAELPGTARPREPRPSLSVQEELEALEAEWVVPEPQIEEQPAPAVPEPASELPDSEPAPDVDYKLLARQLREDQSTKTWFDAELPGSASALPELPLPGTEQPVAVGPAERPLPDRPRGRRLLPGRTKREN